jgi:hypothetical protein
MQPEYFGGCYLSHATKDPYSDGPGHSADPAPVLSYSRNTAPRPLDNPSDSCDNDSIVRNKEENEMLVLECFAVLLLIAILITPAPEVE